MNNFYEENHQQYFDATVGIDPAAFLEPLAGLLEAQATILDIGCGSGRDLRWLVRRGFKPTGFEYSPSLSRLAREHAECPVIEGDFTIYDFSMHQFSALIFVGSLVHLSKKDFSSVFKSISQALAPNGLVLISMKEGSGIVQAADGRVFTLWSQEELEEIFTANNFYILDFSRQISKLRTDDIWLGYVLRSGNDR